jgi:hypothetical protein
MLCRSIACLHVVVVLSGPTAQPPGGVSSVYARRVSGLTARASLTLWQVQPRVGSTKVIAVHCNSRGGTVECDGEKGKDKQVSRSGSEIVSWGVTLSGDWVTSGMGALSGVWVGDMGALTPFHKSDTWKESSPSCRFSWCDDARWVAGATECEIDTYETQVQSV